MTPRRLIEPARLAGAALLHTQSDERLVDLARSGNDRAFEAIVTRYRRPLLRYCRRLLPAERAEDAVQQAFMNAYRAIGAGEAELKLRPWLYRIAHNAALSLLRQNGWSHEELDDQFDGVQQPPQAFEQRERMREVVRAVQDLPERQRDAVIMRELEGRSYEEIAAELGVTGGAVRQLLNRARTNLRAAATALTPASLAELCAGGGVAGAGALAGAAKLGTALVVAGAVAGGTTGAGPLPDFAGGGTGGDGRAEASVPGGAGLDAPGTPGRERGGLAAEEDDRRHGGGKDDRSVDEDGDEEDGSDSSESGSDSSGSDSDSSGSGSSDSDSDSSGSGSSGSGSSSSGSGSSGSGSDDGGSGSGSSGSGSSSSGSGSSGSGSDDGGGSGSGSSGSGSSGSGSSGSGSSGSGSSGSGSSSSGSGSSGSGSDGGGGSGSGSSGSGSSGSGSSG